MIEVIDYQKPEEVTYTTKDIFYAVDKDAQIGLGVIDGQAQFLGWDSMMGDYTSKGLAFKTYDIDTIEALIDAYKNRGK